MITKSLKKTHAFIFNFFFYLNKEMPKVQKPKIYKAVKKNLDGKEFICVQFKNLKTQDVRNVKQDINNLLDNYFAPPEYDEKIEAEAVAEY